jgi:predicted GIY-YIG superfamily endonuclease
MSYTVYILKCTDGKPYTGCAEDLEERMQRHNKGYVPATENRRPVKLITYTVFSDKYRAFEFEKYLKSASGRAFMSKRLI